MLLVGVIQNILWDLVFADFHKNYEILKNMSWWKLVNLGWVTSKIKTSVKYFENLITYEFSGDYHTFMQ